MNIWDLYPCQLSAVTPERCSVNINLSVSGTKDAAALASIPCAPSRSQRSSASSTGPFHVYSTSVSFLKMQNIKALWSKAVQFKGYRDTKGSVPACSAPAAAMGSLICSHYTGAGSIPLSLLPFSLLFFPASSRHWASATFFKGFQMVEPCSIRECLSLVFIYSLQDFLNKSSLEK